MSAHFSKVGFFDVQDRTVIFGFSLFCLVLTSTC